jgi:hypothetical protein
MTCRSRHDALRRTDTHIATESLELLRVAAIDTLLGGAKSELSIAHPRPRNRGAQSGLRLSSAHHLEVTFRERPQKLRARPCVRVGFGMRRAVRYPREALGSDQQFRTG